MSYLSPTSLGAHTLWHQPVSWLVRQFLIYLGAAIIAGAAFVIGAGVYAYLAPPTIVESPSVPLRKPVPTPAVPAPSPLLEGALIAQLKGKEIGVPILMQDRLYGVVTEIQVDEKGTKRFVVIELADSKEKTKWPYDAVNWYTEERAKAQWKHSADETVFGSFKGLWGSLEKDSTKFSPLFQPKER